MSKKYFMQECPDLVNGDTVRIDEKDFLIVSFSEGGYRMTAKFECGTERSFGNADDVKVLAREGDTADYSRATF